MIRGAFGFAMAVMRANWSVILLLLAAVYWPVGVVSVYSDYEAMAGDSGGAMLVAMLFGRIVCVIPDAAICYVGLLHASGERPRFGEALCAGISCSGRMVATRLLEWVSCMSLLLLVFPGLYWMSRWAMCEVNVVHEGTSGAGAFARSWQLTREKRWRVLVAMAVGGGVLVGLVIGVMGLFAMAGDGWWIGGLAWIAISLLIPGWLLFQCGLYVQLTKAECAAGGESG